MLAAFRDGQDWLRAALDYITDNRDFYVAFMRDNLPMLETTVPAGTYLAWIDCCALDIPDEYETAQEYFVEEAQVGMNPGTFFGEDYGDYVRLNFACPRIMLENALFRIKAAVDKLQR